MLCKETKMKYKLHFLYSDMSAVDIEADRYHIQTGMMILEKKDDGSIEDIRAVMKIEVW